jgi:LuxR family maltose regulon positive regulatory protein
MDDDALLLGSRPGGVRLPAAFIPRRRLDALLADGARCPVTLISAPPGAGKTTLATAAFGGRPDAVTLTVDWRDNDVGQLARLVVGALVERGGVGDGVDLGVGVDVDGGVGVGVGHASVRSATLLDAAFRALERRGGRVVLVLDDVHDLTSADALGTLAYLVERAPDVLDVVLCSRADPPVRLTRLRLAGRLGEIRADALAFDLGETADLLSAHGVQLPRAQLHALWERTQGWAAGLRLAACALQDEPDPHGFVQSAAASESVIAEYLLKELLARQDDAVQRFLLRTSIVARLTPELGVTLTGDEGAGVRLAELERNGVVVAEEDDRPWYRYHALFATLLEARLRRYQGELATDLHRRAATWFLEQQLPFEAENHARAAGDWDVVDRLAVGRWVERTLAGVDGADAVVGLLTDVPPAAIAANPGLAMVAGAEACARRDEGAADHHRGNAAGRSPDMSPHPVPLALLDLTRARVFGTNARGHAAVVSLGEPAGGVLAQVAALGAIALGLDEGDLQGARRTAESVAVTAEGTWVGAEAVATLALIAALSGDLDAAERHRTAAPVTVQAPGRATLRLVADLAAALCHAQRGEHKHAADAVDRSSDGATPSDRWLGALDRAVRSTLHTAGSAVVGLDGDDLEHPLVDRALVALGVLEAVDAVGRVRVAGGPLEASVLLARQRWGSGDCAGVLRALDGMPELAPDVARRRMPKLPPDAAHPRTVIERWVLTALAADGAGRPEEAVVALRGALGLADATGILAPLLVPMPALAGVLERYAAALDREQALALELIDRAQQSPAPAFVEPLTEREVAVLRHLPTLMSNNEIASGLHLSVNTVKTHLKSLYRKLGVTSRREAVQRGRALELL